MSLPADFLRRIAAATSQRAARFNGGETTAWRWLNGSADGLPHVTVDRFGDVAVVNLYAPFSGEDEGALSSALLSAGARSVFLKRRPKEARVEATVRKEELAPKDAVAGEPVESLWVAEKGLRYLIQPGQGLTVGLFLDMREGREAVRAGAEGLSVLNLFAFTCGFGVAARAGGATRVLNVDLSRRVLDWGRENLSGNGLPALDGDFFAADVFDWLKRAAKREERFDLVVLDPPSFSTSKKSRFSAATDYPDVAEAAARLLNPGGRLFAFSNLTRFSPRDLQRAALAGASRVWPRAKVVGSLAASPLDFPAAEEVPGVTKGVVIVT